MKEVVDGYELVEGTGIQSTADLNVVSSQQSHRRSVLLLEHLPLERRAEQQEVVVCRVGVGGQKREGQRVTRGGTGSKTMKINSQNMNEGLGLMAKSGR